MSSKPVLRLDWCSHEAAKYAVMNWHYSQSMPMPPLVKIGVWEDDEYIGCVLFGRGANNAVGARYALSQLEVCELVRVALRRHRTPVSRIVAVALRMLRKSNPGVRLVVSYADEDQGHLGGIYQAGGWVYVGRGQPTTHFFHQGRWKHNREVTGGAFGGSRKVADYHSLPTKVVQGKHKYLMPLDDEMRKQIAPLAKPYPKKTAPRAESLDSEAAPFHGAEGGATPTSALHDTSPLDLRVTS